jgi:hypothetical protein
MRLSTGGSKSKKKKVSSITKTGAYNLKSKMGRGFIMDDFSEKNRLSSRPKAFGRKGSAANQKRMVENEANGTAWDTGYKTGLPKKVKKKSNYDKAKAMSKWFN